VTEALSMLSVVDAAAVEALRARFTEISTQDESSH